MPKKAETEKLLIKNIAERFLKKEYQNKAKEFKSIKEILDLPIFALKDATKLEAAQIGSFFNCSNIDELGELDPINPIEAILPDPSKFETEQKYDAHVKNLIKRILEAFDDFQLFRTHISVANMIKRSYKKREAYLQKKRETKFICVGLDNAGKTAILTGLGGKLGITELNKLKPTKKIERKKVLSKNLELFIWDFGGQDSYRREYLKNPEQYFINTDMLLYVIDMQDPARYDESFEYLIEILDVMKMLGENPYILAFMHKSDPDILDDPDFQLNSEYVADKLNYHLSNYGFEYDIYTTSIFNFFTSEPKFSRFIKETLSDKESLNNPLVRKVEGLGEILDSTLNAIITLANSLNSQILELSNRISNLEQRFENELANSSQQGPNGYHPNISINVRPPMRPNINSPSPAPTQIKKQIIYRKPAPSGAQNIPGFHMPASASMAGGASASGVQGNSAQTSGDPRLQILNDLKALFQVKKTLDKTNPINKLGSLGKKFKETQKDAKSSAQKAVSDRLKKSVPRITDSEIAGNVQKIKKTPRKGSKKSQKSKKSKKSQKSKKSKKSIKTKSKK